MTANRREVLGGTAAALAAVQLGGLTFAKPRPNRVPWIHPATPV
jgi:hypothetical protein